MKTYHYVGDEAILRQANLVTRRQKVSSPTDVVTFSKETHPEPPVDSLYWFTYIIGADGHLYIADRRSEHVACSRKEPVLAAGEIAFGIAKSEACLEHIDNRSNGFRPSTDCWEAIVNSLEKAQIQHEGSFTQAFEFRKCTCGHINTVRDAFFYCDICEKELPQEYNIQ